MLSQCTAEMTCFQILDVIQSTGSAPMIFPMKSYSSFYWYVPDGCSCNVMSDVCDHNSDCWMNMTNRYTTLREAILLSNGMEDHPDDQMIMQLDKEQRESGMINNDSGKYAFIGTSDMEKITINRRTREQVIDDVRKCLGEAIFRESQRSIRASDTPRFH